MESHSFLSLPAHTTMASSQGTSVSSNPFSTWTLHDIFLFKFYFLLHILRFLSFFSDNIMADVASKQQTTALFLSTTVTGTRRHKELTEKLTNLMGNLCCARDLQFRFRRAFLNSWTARFNLDCVGPFWMYRALKCVRSPLDCVESFRVYGDFKIVRAHLELWGAL